MYYLQSKISRYCAGVLYTFSKTGYIFKQQVSKRRDTMQKKVLLALLMAALLAGGAFAEGFSMSAGAGLLSDYSGNNGVKNGGDYLGVRILSLGFYGFFDAKYAEADISFAYGRLSGVAEGNAGNFIPATDFDSRIFQLGITLLGKYPFEVGEFTLFPLLGFNYNLVFSHTVAGARDPEPGRWTQIGILTGAGGDFDLTDNLYLRGEGMFHLRFPPTVWKDVAAVWGGSATLGMGPRFKFGVGYRF